MPVDNLQEYEDPSLYYIRYEAYQAELPLLEKWAFRADGRCGLRNGTDDHSTGEKRVSLTDALHQSAGNGTYGIGWIDK